MELSYFMFRKVRGGSTAEVCQVPLTLPRTGVYTVYLGRSCAPIDNYRA